MTRITASSNGTTHYYQMTAWWKAGCAEVECVTHNSSDPASAIQNARQYAARPDVKRVELLYICNQNGRQTSRKVKFQ